MIVLTLPLLDRHAWRPLALITALTTLGLWSASFAVPWTRLPRRCSLLFPLTGWAALTLLGAATHGIAASYSGLYVLWFAYIGLTQASGTSLWLAPIAIVAYVVAWGGLSEPLIARLLIAVSVWLLLAELLAALVHRQRLMTDELRRLAHVDTLTSLANRRDLDLRMADTHSGDTLVICDLDHFKRVNDTYGHATGDRVLAEFGLVLRSCLRQLDYAARYGGEEFALLLPGTSEAQAASMLARLRECWKLLQPEVTFSSGVAACRADRSATDTLAIADKALYAAKAAGRNQDHGNLGPLVISAESMAEAAH
ncbi:MAG: GGDEF domain-containing protein [Actinomycetota bacterium]|nr:GGDEF domain-containing protein [Actinomycetota bacterium]